MATGLSTVAGRRRLCAALKRAREERSLTQQEVATVMEWSLSKIIRVESGIVGVSATDLHALLTLYSVTDPIVVNDLMELARAGRRRPWWRGYRDHMTTPTLGTLIDLEVMTSSMKIFNPTILPGLFQTREYATAVVQNVCPAPSTEQLEARVEIRMRRQQEVLGRPDPPKILTVLDEAVLRRSTGDDATTRQQLDHLLGIATSQHVTMRILPFDAGVFQLTGPFFIMSFPDDPDIVFVESSINEKLIEGNDRIQDYRDAFDLVLRNSLSEEESLALTRNARDASL